MNLEMRPVHFEDTARMVIGLGTPRKSPMTFVEEIGAITPRDLARVGDRLLSSARASVVSYGNLRRMPTYESIDAVLANRDVCRLRTPGDNGGSKYWKFGR